MLAIQPGLLADTPVQIVKIKKRLRRSVPRVLVAKVLLLGGGRQSSLLADMQITGELEKTDLVVFNDTHDEPAWVYQQVGNLRERLATIGVPLVIYHADCYGIMANLHSVRPRGSMPLYVRKPNGAIGHGRLSRQCTPEYKVRPGNLAIKLWLIRQDYIQLPPHLKYIPDQFGHLDLYENGILVYDYYQVRLPPIPRDIGVEVWYGYTVDERIRAERLKPIGWQLPRFPLIEKRLSREDCGEWYTRRGRPIPLKSACIQCPYRDDVSWLWMKTEWPEEFERACRYDDMLRDMERFSRFSPYARIRGKMYVHASCMPLRDINFEELVAARKARLPRSMFEIELVDSCQSDGGFSCMS